MLVIKLLSFCWLSWTIRETHWHWAQIISFTYLFSNKAIIPTRLDSHFFYKVRLTINNSHILGTFNANFNKISFIWTCIGKNTNNRFFSSVGLIENIFTQSVLLSSFCFFYHGCRISSTLSKADARRETNLTKSLIHSQQNNKLIASINLIRTLRRSSWEWTTFWN